MNNILEKLGISEINYGACIGGDRWIESNDSGIIKSINPTDNNGLPDQLVPASVGGEFKSFVFSSREIQPFTQFQIKIDMVGTSQAEPPLIKELRAIALA